MAVHELILGGARSGKSRRAEARAAAWLQGGGTREAVLIATAVAGDDEMAQRIARHRADRAARAPALLTHELSGNLDAAVRAHSSPARLVLVDCLTLWLTQLALPLNGAPATAVALEAVAHDLAAALRAAPGPVVLVSNEIGLGVMPLGADTRRFLDALGFLHQTVAACCGRVCLMVAGLELVLKGDRA